MLTEKAVRAFQEIYKRKFKKELNEDEAFLKANKLLDLYRLTYGSLSIEQIKKARENMQKTNNS